jgi:uncharacterized repeat protein (TIGR01451 family)
MHMKQMKGIGLGAVVLLAVAADGFALTGSVQGLHKVHSTNFTAASAWTNAALQGWRELDWVACRLRMAGGPQNTQPVAISFPRFAAGNPAFQDLQFLSNSANVRITQSLPLNSTNGSNWFQQFTLDVTNSQPADLYFRVRLAAGAHLAASNALRIDGLAGFGPVVVATPPAAAGAPDLAVTKSGPATAVPTRVLTFTLAYTNKAGTTNTATGAQLSDVLPASLSYVAGSANPPATAALETLVWNLGNLAPGAAGTVSYQAVVASNAAIGLMLTNQSRLASAENDAAPADNVAAVVTTVVANRAPVPAGNAYSTVEDTPLAISAPGILGNDSDPDGDPIIAILAAPAVNGTVALLPDGSFNYTPRQNFAGFDAFTYRVSDGISNSGTVAVTIQVTPVADVPVASNDTYTVGLDASFVTSVPGVLGNDFDGDGDVLRAVLVSGPANGLLTLNSNGSLVYVPTPGFTGVDTFTYRASDGVLISEAATVTFNVQALPPVVYGPPQNQIVCAGGTANFNVVAAGTHLVFQWRKGGADLPGQTNSSLAITGVSVSTTGAYSVVVSGVTGSPITNTAQLLLNTPVTATPLTSLVRGVETMAAFNTVASGTGPFSYAWLKDGVIIPGRTGSRLSFTNLTEADTATYSVIVSGMCDSVTNSATLTVNKCFPSADVMVVIDRSASMIGQAYTDARTACSNFVHALWMGTNADQAGLVSYSTLSTINQTLTNSIAAFELSVNNLPSAANGTCISCGLQTALAELNTMRHRTNSLPVVVLMSDGLPNGADTVNNALANAQLVKEAGVRVFSIGLGAVDHGLMAGIASSTNDYFYTANSSQLTLLFNAIADVICRPPTNIFVTWPSNRTVCAGAPVTFSVTASNCAGFRYQWSLNGTPLAGRTNSSLSIPAATASDAGVYRIAVLSDCQNLTNTVTLTVQPQTAVTNPPLNQVSSVGGGAQFNVGAVGVGLTYQWRFNGALVGTNATLALNGITTNHAGTYCVAVSGVCGAPVTNCATLTLLNQPPVANPESYSTAEDAPLTVLPVAGVLANDSDPDGNALVAVLIEPPAGGVVTLQANGGFTYAPPGNFHGTVTFRYAASDGSLASTSLVTIVVTPVNDPPTVGITSPADGDVFVAPATVLVAATAADFDGTVVNVRLYSGASQIGSFAAAPYSVTLSNQLPGIRTFFAIATDNGGLSATSAPVTINITSPPPVFVCATNKTIESGTAWTFDPPVIVSSCGTASVVTVSTVTNALCGGAFNATRTWRVADQCGNTSICAQVVAVLDRTAPAITCATNRTVEAGTLWGFDTPAASDLNGVVVTVVSTVTNTGPCGASLTATRTWQATDPCGNSNRCSQTVTMVDTTAPTITCASNKTVELGSVWTFDEPATSDASVVIVSVVSTVTNSASCGAGFVATRTWSAVDACGNSNQCAQTVTAADRTAPTITCASNKTVEAGSVWDFDEPVVSDLSSFTVTVVSTVRTPMWCVSQAVRTWAVVDACGNSNGCSQIVMLVDTTGPEIICASNKTVELGSVWTFDEPTATDLNGATVTILLTVTNAGTCGSSFTATRTWRATDDCLNSSLCSQTVTAADTTAPVITCAPFKTVEAGGAWDFDAPTASDLSMFVVTVAETTTNAAFCGGGFVATRAWDATDACGNVSRCVQVVSAVDTTAPTLVCATNKTVELGGAWNFDEPTASDVSSFIIAVVDTATNAGACGAGFVASRTWSATDDCGNASRCVQTVTVVDTTAPAIVCASNKTVELGAEWTFDPPSVADLSSNSVSVVSTVTNSGTCGAGYSATRVWRATDACGNSNECAQTVFVNDRTPPVITCAPDRTVELGAEWTFDAPAVSDLSSFVLEVVATTTNAGSCGAGFVATRTWRATDVCGNGSECRQTVTVLDRTAPELVCAPNRAVSAGTAWAFEPPAFTDHSAVTVVTVSTVTNSTCPDTYTATRTWRGTDVCGNSATCSQTVSVDDSTPPAVSIVTPTNNAVLAFPATFPVIASAFDAGGIASVEIFHGTNSAGVFTEAPFFTTVSNAGLGVYSYRAVATDRCGHVSTSAVVTVTVVTNIAAGGPIALNRQNGLFEQQVIVSNLTFETWANGVRLYVHIDATNKVFNASGTNGGVPYVDSHVPVPAGGTSIVLVQYYVPNPRVIPSPLLIPVPLPYTPPAPEPPVMARTTAVVDGMADIAFTTQARRWYFVQYSDDLVRWFTHPVPVAGTGGVVHFTQPAGVPHRFYRARLVP